ncbi:MAG: CaiB/BaiF CoA-transferase family protein [Dehalococcoidia bacterium]
MAHPLDGVKIIEIATYAPANMAAGWLADLGADIIVVEPPSNRALGPEWDKSDRLRHVENRNKRGIGLNLREPEGQAILHRMVQDADILIEANRPGVAKRLGFDYETLSKINPRIIVCSSTGYGQQGPMSHLPGHGRVWEATGGWLLTQGTGLGNMGGDYTGVPYMNPFNLADIKSAPYILSTILAALYARTNTGEGQHLDIALFDAVIAVRNPATPARGDEAWERHTAANGVYVCKDGRYIAFAVSEALQWKNMCTGVGHPEFESEFRPSNARADEIRAIFARRFMEKTRDEWFAELSQYDMEVAPVLTLDESASNPQVKLRNMHVEVTDDAGYHQVQYGAPFHLSKTPPKIKHRRAPRFGEHTEQVLAELGYSAGEIAKLTSSGVAIAKQW